MQRTNLLKAGGVEEVNISTFTWFTKKGPKADQKAAVGKMEKIKDMLI